MPIDFVKDILSDVRPENHEYQQIVDVVDTADSGETETSDIFGLDGNRDMTAEYG